VTLGPHWVGSVITDVVFVYVRELEAMNCPLIIQIHIVTCFQDNGKDFLQQVHIRVAVQSEVAYASIPPTQFESWKVACIWNEELQCVRTFSSCCWIETLE
jgi:hypothetical protein